MKNKEKDGSLATIYPELAAQWHPTRNGELTPEKFRPGSNKRVWWICSKGHEWEAVVKSRVKGNGCPYCAGKKAMPGFNDLRSTHGVLAKQWHPIKNGELDPSTIKAGSGKKVWWQCDHGHEWQATPLNRKNGKGCPYCSGLVAVREETSLAATHPHLAKQWHPIKNGELTSENVKSGSKRTVWWQCSCGAEWDCTPLSRVRGRGKCPVCGQSPAEKG